MTEGPTMRGEGLPHAASKESVEELPPTIMETRKDELQASRTMAAAMLKRMRDE